MKYTVMQYLAKKPEQVFPYLLTDVDKFWPEDMEGESQNIGDEFVFTSGELHYSKNKVIELIPAKKLVWLVTDSIRKTDNFNWTGTRMTFELAPQNGGTQLAFTYDGPVLPEEAERLTGLCDWLIKEKFYHLVMSYTLTLNLPQPAATVFEHLKKISYWWTEDFTGKCDKPGDEFIIHHPGTHYAKHRVVEYIPNQKLVWLVTESRLYWLKNQDEWTGTQMIFELNNGQLHFTHEGLTPNKESYGRCSQGWREVIVNRLSAYINQ